MNRIANPRPDPLRPFATFNGVPYRHFKITQEQDLIDITMGGLGLFPADPTRKFAYGPTETSGEFDYIGNSHIRRTHARGCRVSMTVRRSGRLVYQVTGLDAGSLVIP